MSFILHRMKLIVSFFLFTMLAFPAAGQTDSVAMVKYTPEFRFEEGIYINFEAVKSNSPIAPERIISQNKSEDLSFYDQLFEQKKLFYFDEFGTKQEISVEQLWGYSKMGVLFIQHNQELNRIPIVGSICHFVSTITFESYRTADPFYNPYRVYDPYSYNYRTQPVVSKEMRQFILDWESGAVYSYDRESLEVILMRDSALYEEFNALSKRKQKKMLFHFLRRYNDQHPVFLPVKP